MTRRSDARGPGLRERKKEATRRRLQDAARELFVERGFDGVSVAEVAAAAEVSEMTVYNYFPAKEDLIVGADETSGLPVRIIRERAAGQTPGDALKKWHLAGLAEREPLTGLCDDPRVLGVVRLVRGTPALSMRWYQLYVTAQYRVATHLADEEGCPGVTAHVFATQVLGVHHVLVRENQGRVLMGASADELYPLAVTEAEEAFALLEEGLGDRLRR